MKNGYFSCRLLKTADTKNESLFLVTAEIISRHHKKIIGVTINRFSSSDNSQLSTTVLDSRTTVDTEYLHQFTT
jgi:hypothetical protein